MQISKHTASTAVILLLMGSQLLSAATAKPNILWLIAEDFGPHLACYGTKEVYTPILDAMAKNGTRYTRFYTTAPVCSPSRSAFMTGMYATSIGAHNHRSNRDAKTPYPLPEGVRLITDWMRDAGYYTANVRNLPVGMKFKGTGKTDWNFSHSGKPFDTDKWSDLKIHQPFFAQINFHETHRKFNGEKRADPAKVEIPLYEPDHPITRQDRASYLDAASELDRKIGLIFKQLAVDGLLNNTVVLFFGDNGESSIRGKQFCYEEGLHVPLIIQWPKDFPEPKHYKPGQVDDRLLMSIDLAPTMLALAGAKQPAKMEGIVFLGEQSASSRQYVFGARDRCDMTIMCLRTVRDDRYRYIRNFTPYTPFLARNAYKENSYPVWNLLKQLNAESKLTSFQSALCQTEMPAEELYDLVKDPQQVHNLASSVEHSAVKERMRGVLRNWITKTGDQGQRLETLEEVQKAEPRFVLEQDWREPKK